MKSYQLAIAAGGEALALLNRPDHNIPGVQTFTKEDRATLREAIHMLVCEAARLQGWQDGAREAIEIRKGSEG